MIADWREVKSVGAQQQSHRMFHIVSILLCFVVGKRILSIVEFVVSDAVFEGMGSNARCEGCRGTAHLVADVATIVVFIQFSPLVSFDRMARGQSCCDCFSIGRGFRGVRFGR